MIRIFTLYIKYLVLKFKQKYSFKKYIIDVNNHQYRDNIVQENSKNATLLLQRIRDPKKNNLHTEQQALLLKYEKLGALNHRQTRKKLQKESQSKSR